MTEKFLFNFLTVREKKEKKRKEKAEADRAPKQARLPKNSACKSHYIQQEWNWATLRNDQGDRHYVPTGWTCPDIMERQGSALITTCWHLFFVVFFTLLIAVLKSSKKIKKINLWLVFPPTVRPTVWDQRCVLGTGPSLILLLRPLFVLGGLATPDQRINPGLCILNVRNTFVGPVKWVGFKNRCWNRQSLCSVSRRSINTCWFQTAEWPNLWPWHSLYKSTLSAALSASVPRSWNNQCTIVYTGNTSMDEQGGERWGWGVDQNPWAALFQATRRNY